MIRYNRIWAVAIATKKLAIRPLTSAGKEPLEREIKLMFVATVIIGLALVRELDLYEGSDESILGTESGR